jgi:diguanylate cyclase (GGDEF)-like protein
MKHCQERIIRMKKIGILFIDLDGFKAINDSYGHDAGDFLLKNISHRLKDCVDERGLMSRLAGDIYCSVPRSF